MAENREFIAFFVFPNNVVEEKLKTEYKEGRGQAKTKTKMSHQKRTD